LIPQNGSVKTENGTAEIVFGNKARVKLDKNTELNISTLDIKDGVDQNFKIVLKLLFGRIWNRVVNLSDKTSFYEVETQDTVSAVRGTKFEVSFLGATTTVRVFENKVAVSLVENADKKIDVAENKMVVLNKQSVDSVLRGVAALQTAEFVPIIRPTPEEIKQGIRPKLEPWIEQNLREDKVFDKMIESAEENLIDNNIIVNTEEYQKLRSLWLNATELQNIINTLKESVNSANFVLPEINFTIPEEQLKALQEEISSQYTESRPALIDAENTPTETQEPQTGTTDNPVNVGDSDIIIDTSADINIQTKPVLSGQTVKPGIKINTNEIQLLEVAPDAGVSPTIRPIYISPTINTR
jgi:hypothetical protein